jgi:hypothetical protein
MSGVKRTNRSKNVPVGHARNVSVRETKTAPSHPEAMTRIAAGPIRSDIQGLSPILDAVGHRQFDLWSIWRAEWRAMSPRQRADLIKHQNLSDRSDHKLGPSYLMSPALERAVTRARDLYVRMTPEQRRKTLHPKHLDHWLENRRVITIVARDFDDGPLPDFLLPKSHRIRDEGPAPTWQRSVSLTLAINLDASLQSVLDAVEDLIVALHAPAARRPRRGSSSRLSREKYDDDGLANMIEWYYRRAAGESLKQLVAETTGPTARHVTATRTKILRQIRWFRRELGIA